MKERNNNHEQVDAIRFYIEDRDKVSMCVEQDGRYCPYDRDGGLVDTTKPLDPNQAIFNRFAIAQIFLCEPTGTPWQVDIDGLVSLEDQMNQIEDNRGTDREWIAVCTYDDEGIDAVVALAHPTNANFLVHAVNMLGQLEESISVLLAAAETAIEIIRDSYGQDDVSVPCDCQSVNVLENPVKEVTALTASDKK